MACMIFSHALSRAVHLNATMHYFALISSHVASPHFRLWDVETGECLSVLEGHIDEIFSCAFNYEGDTIITGSKDNTCRIWKC